MPQGLCYNEAQPVLEAIRERLSTAMKTQCSQKKIISEAKKKKKFQMCQIYSDTADSTGIPWGPYSSDICWTHAACFQGPTALVGRGDDSLCLGSSRTVKRGSFGQRWWEGLVLSLFHGHHTPTPYMSKQILNSTPSFKLSSYPVKS